MNFCGYFSAEDAGRLAPFKDDKRKDTKNSQFVASSVLVVKATGRIETSLVPPWKSNREVILLFNRIINTNIISKFIIYRGFGDYSPINYNLSFLKEGKEASFPLLNFN